MSCWLTATLQRRGDLIGRDLFEAMPDNRSGLPPGFDLARARQSLGTNVITMLARSWAAG